MIIDILEWNISYSQLMHWIATNGAIMHAVNGYGTRGVTSTHYRFENEEDYIAFKLAFAKENNSIQYRFTKMAYYNTHYILPTIPYPSE